MEKECSGSPSFAPRKLGVKPRNELRHELFAINPFAAVERRHTFVDAPSQPSELNSADGLVSFRETARFPVKLYLPNFMSNYDID